MNFRQHTLLGLKRDCPATLIPSGEKITLYKDEPVTLMQSLGGNFTIKTGMGYLVLIDGLDADALGLEKTLESEVSEEEESFDLEKVIEKLKTVFDPEIPVNIVDLGLIYLCEAHPLPEGGYLIEIKMSMTAPGCGMGDILKGDARKKVESVGGVREVDIEIVWEPAWDPSRMSEAAKLQLGLF